VSIVLMMQMAIDQIVRVIAVRYRLMAAVRAMDVRSIVTVANMPSCAGLRIRLIDIQCMLFHNSRWSLVM